MLALSEAIKSPNDTQAKQSVFTVKIDATKMNRLGHDQFVIFYLLSPSFLGSDVRVDCSRLGVTLTEGDCLKVLLRSNFRIPFICG